MRILFHFIFCITTVIIGGCGGGEEDERPEPSHAVHSVMLGPVAGATVNIYSPDCKLLAYTTTTGANGGYTVDTGKIFDAFLGWPPALLCIESVGGVDTDPNDDGIKTPEEATPVIGEFRGYVLYDDIVKNKGAILNIFGAAIADLVHDSPGITTEQINQFAATLNVPDVDGDGKITISDVVRYEMGKGSSGEIMLRSQYLAAILEGNGFVRSILVKSQPPISRSVTASIEYISRKAFLKLMASSKENKVYYTTNPLTPIDLYKSGPSITYVYLDSDDRFFFKECNKNLLCSETQSVRITKFRNSIESFKLDTAAQLTSYLDGEARALSYIQQIQQIKIDKAKVDSEILSVQADIKKITQDKSAAEARKIAIEEELRKLQRR